MAPIWSRGPVETGEVSELTANDVYAFCGLVWWAAGVIAI